MIIEEKDAFELYLENEIARWQRSVNGHLNDELEFVHGVKAGRRSGLSSGNFIDITLGKVQSLKEALETYRGYKKIQEKGSKHVD